MFELIIDGVPELGRLEQALAALETEHGEAQAKVAALSNKVTQAREDDLNREALALNNGRKTPKPKEPELRTQLERAQREFEVLERRLTLAGSDRSRYIQEHQDELMGLLAEAHASEGQKVAEGAGQVLQHLLRRFQVEDASRQLQRVAPTPAPVEEGEGEPAKSTIIWGPMTTQNVAGGPPRGSLEGTLRYLASLGTETVVEGSEGGADAA